MVFRALCYDFLVQVLRKVGRVGSGMRPQKQATK